MKMSDNTTNKRPNLVLVTTDQQRWDAMSLAGHPELMTPIMDNMAHLGAWCRRAYSPAPICCPARHTILTGCEPATNGVLNNMPARIARPNETLPALLRAAGYQTAEFGRSMHQHPSHARYGFDFRRNSPIFDHDSEVHTAIRSPNTTERPHNLPHLLDHAMTTDGYRARPWPYEERFHHTTWTVNATIDFLKTRDMDVPFFMHVGFVAPHPPLVPPACYYDRYAFQKLTEPVVGDWVTPPENNALGQDVYSGYVPLGGPQIQTSMAGYYGLVNHVDDMLFKLRVALPPNTVVLFCSDHGEMLGDHHRFRKALPFEAVTRVPFMCQGPGVPSVAVDEPVSLADILPTFCELAGVAIPAHVEGRSLLPLWRRHAREDGWDGADFAWRPWVHGEGPATPIHGGYHYLTDGRTKYIRWGDGSELLFDVERDPRETRDLSARPDYAETLAAWRERLIEKLRDRPEGFVRDGKLVPGVPHEPLLPHALSLSAE